MQLSTIVNNSTTLTMSSREISELVESRHDSVKRTIERLTEKGVVSFTPSVETSHEGAGARSVEVYRVNKRDSFVVVAQLCPEFTARIVDRWQELEQKEQFQSKLDTTAEQDIRILSAVSDMLRLSDSGRIGMVRKYIENETPKLKAYLPAYAIDAPTDSTSVGNSSQVTKCATDLLMLHNAKVTTRKFNEMLVEKGFLETQMRPSANKVMKPFKCITEKGLKYGKNLTSDKNQKETQPHWYVNKFTELLNELGL